MHNVMLLTCIVLHLQSTMHMYMYIITYNMYELEHTCRYNVYNIYFYHTCIYMYIGKLHVHVYTLHAICYTCTCRYTNKVVLGN